MIDKPFPLGNAIITRQTDKAIQVEIEGDEEVWIPKAVIHDDSEVYDVDKGPEGRLIVFEWWAEKHGYT